MCLNELWFIINYKDDTFWYLLIRPVQKINKAHVSLISNFPFVLFYYNHRGEMETHIQELCIEWNSENRSRVLSENVGGKTRGATVFIWMWSEISILPVLCSRKASIYEKLTEWVLTLTWSIVVVVVVVVVAHATKICPSSKHEVMFWSGMCFVRLK